MGINLERDIERFLRQQLSKNRESPLHRIVLRHAATGKKGNEIDSFEMGEAVTIDALTHLTADVIARAQEDANGMGGVHRYTLLLMEKGESKPAARFMFRLRGEDYDFDEGGGEESATSPGLLSQLMRHNEANNRTMVSAIGGLVSTMVRRLDASDRLVEKLTEQRMQTLDMLENAMSQQHTRDMELLQTESGEKRKDQIFEKITLLLPAVVNKIAGQKVLDGSDPMLLMVKGFAESLTPEQFQVLQKSLSQEQQITLIQLLQAVKYQPKKLSNGEK